MDYALILVIAFSTIFFFGAQSAKFTFTNNCHYTVWPATLTGGGGAQVSPTGFELSPKASYSLNIPSPWSGRLWGRTFCSTDHAGKFTCATGDCGSGQISCVGAGAIPPASLVEFTLAPNNGEDFYDISLVDGFNLPVSVTPSASSGTAGTCRTASCPADLNRHCPRRLAVKAKSGVKIGCKSACLAFNTPEYCCTGEYGTPQTCRPTRFSEYFKSRCDQAYSYAYDDKTSTFTCSGGPNYHITFCP